MTKYNNLSQSVPLDRELRGHALFAGLNDEQLSKVKAGIRMVQLTSGEHLFSHGQPADNFYLVRSGQIKLYRLSPAGNEKVIEIIRPGQAFAEALMFMSAPVYPVSAQTLTAADVYIIDNHQFLEVLRGSVDTCFRLMADISVRLHQLLNEIDALTLQNATLRLVSYLLELVPMDAENAVELELPVAKNIIASRLSIQPETLSRILSQLSEQNLVIVKGLNVQLLDIEELRACYEVP